MVITLLGDHHVFFGEFIILMCLLAFHENKHEPFEYQILKNTHLDKARFKEFLSSLVKKHWVQCAEEEKDPKLRLIYLTDKGFHQVTHLIELIKQLHPNLLSGFSPEHTLKTLSHLHRHDEREES